MVVDGDDGFDGSGRRMEGRSWWEMTACRAPSCTVEFHSRWMRAISVHSDHQKELTIEMPCAPANNGPTLGLIYIYAATLSTI